MLKAAKPVATQNPLPRYKSGRRGFSTIGPQTLAGNAIHALDKIVLEQSQSLGVLTATSDGHTGDTQADSNQTQTNHREDTRCAGISQGGALCTAGGVATRR